MVFNERFVWGCCLGIVISILATACGAVGPPIPPEDVGIEAKLLEHSKKTALPEGEAIPIEEEAPKLPLLRPIGSR